ncbi:hypothetical protein [Chryseobacterium indologenes]|uniref:hypothetical protein n=1 Tax=Chryseobacterium indologenes TaxID=253 RepID=UPI001BCB19A3|nr:hypothetical protein [Chryseobacterium indologenes]
MNIKTIVLFWGLAISNFCFSQQKFRENFTLKLPVDSVRYYQQEVKKSPYFVEENTLQIYPGEHLFIAADIKEGKLESMKVVKENVNPSKTIEIEFSQDVEGRKHKGMMLQVSNPFDKNLLYDATMYTVEESKWVETSILPVKPKLAGFELWNDVIITLVLHNWRLQN